MILAQALEKMKHGSETMNARYGRVVFDEWAFVSLQSGRERIVAYEGPRREHFQQNFTSDLGGLRCELLTTKHEPGHFDFARQAVGTSFEAFICVGEELYLICNNTQLTMDQISGDARWLEAQKSFAALTDAFRSDPMVNS
jgi:hypothetical protein